MRELAPVRGMNELPATLVDKRYATVRLPDPQLSLLRTDRRAAA
jgi:hypothetical protein